MSYIEITEKNFETEVLRRSYETPVVVDFWAPWCGPCRTLGPVLDQLAGEANGTWVLAKVNTDVAQQLATDYRIQGIPNVKAFVNGKVVDEFAGALPRHMIEQWLKKIIPSDTDKSIVAARGYLKDGLFDQALPILEAAHVDEPQRVDVRIYLAELYARTNKVNRAAEILASIPEYEQDKHPKDFGTAWLLVEAAQAATRGDAAQRLQAAPDDLQARWDLALAKAAAGDYEEALRQLLELFKKNRAWNSEAARKGMVRLFKVQGDDHPRTAYWRAELGRWMY
jgi:putative thioredoxin